MCGIAGIYNGTGISPDTSTIRAMSTSLSHRGPDEEGFHIGNHVHLASRRLSIIDLGAGSQPIYNHEGTACIVFNGEIYNYLSIREELISRGYVFRSRTDTEVVLNAYREWGERCLDRFNGMFAVCIWDSVQRELFLARDRFGIKPLYYSELPDGTFLFASEIKAILRYPAVKKQIRRNAVDNLLTFGFNVAPYTFFEDIKQVLPGHFMRMTSRGRSYVQYWDIDLESPLLDCCAEEIAQEFRSKFEESVRIGVIADVPVATYLSGGIDSSSITGMYSHLCGQKIKTLTILFENAGYDEREYSKKVSDFFDTEYLEFDCSIQPDEILDLVYHLENPIVSLLNLPFFLLSKKARETGTKVVLTGDGADEILGGYDYFKVLKAMAFIDRSESDFRKSVLRRIYPHLAAAYNLDSMYCMLKIAAARFPVSHPAAPYRYQTFQFKQKLYSPEFAMQNKHSPPDEPFFFNTEVLAHRSLMDQALYIEIKMRLLNLTLPLSDKMSMANSVEARPLFLNHDFVNFLFRIPPHLKMLGLSEKHILKRSMMGLVPEEICKRRKQPFQPPAGWFIEAAGELLRDCLSSDKIRKLGCFDPEFVSLMLSEYDRNSKTGYSDLIVAVFFVQLWHEVFFG